MTKTLEPRSRVKLQKEIAIFLGVTGFLLGVAAYATFTMLAGKGLPLWGMARNLAIGMPLAILSAWHFIAAVGLATSGKNAFAIFGAISGTCFTLFYFFFMISATGKFPINLISGAIIAIPLVLWPRVWAYRKA